MALSGYNSGSDSNDVTFEIQRFCPGVGGEYWGHFADNYKVIGRVTGNWDTHSVSNDPVLQHHASTAHNAWNKGCFLQVYTDCYADKFTGMHCDKSDWWSPSENQPWDCGLSSASNPMKATCTRNSDTDDNKEWCVHMCVGSKAHTQLHREITIQEPQKACWKMDDSCGSDWRATYCNASE